MNTKAQIFILIVVLLCAGLPGGFARSRTPLDQQDGDGVDQEIRQSIEKTYPLPEAATIKTHVGDDVTFSTELSVGDVVAFYRTAYAQQGFSEGRASWASADSASLVFQKAGEKEVLLDVIGTEKSQEVHLHLK